LSAAATARLHQPGCISKASVSEAASARQRAATARLRQSNVSESASARQRDCFNLFDFADIWIGRWVEVVL